MGEHQGPPLFSTGSRVQWWLLVGGVAVVWALGAAGFLRHGVPWPDALYYSLQLFAFEQPPVPTSINRLVEGARWGAALLTSVAVIGVASRTFSSELRAWQRRRASGHTVICADGVVAVDLARALVARERRSRVWLLTPDEASAETISARVPGVRLLAGRPEALIASVAVHRARQVIIAGGDDSANVAIAAHVCEATRSGRPVDAPPLTCQVQIRNVHLRESLRRFSIPAEQSKSYVRSFDFFEHAARRLLTTTVPIDGEGVSELDDRRIHVVVVGGNEWALTVAACAARVGHFANRRRLQLTSIVSDLAGWERSLLDRYPVFREVCDYNGAQSDPSGRATLTRVAKYCEEPGVRVVVVACPADDARALELVSEWSQVVRPPGVPFAVQISRGGGLEALVQDRAREDGLNLVPFGWLDEAACASLLEDDVREEMAKLVQIQFRQLSAAQGRRQIVDRAVAEWAQLALEDYKESNRQQVDHIPIKLRAIRCEPAPLDDPRPQAAWSVEEIEVLAEMEHSRWVAERRLAGWSFREGKKDERARTNPNLIPWKDLSEPIRDYDRDAVMNIPDLLREVAKQKVVRAAVRM